ncbi:peptide/nickel transport system permease protein [Actinomadura luteofluorescens]|uniref:Peptide/nickel transport system permease protein n=1 Tax=Actinomadura luteofluorescens TaxID=46163 RepID=A0A7Y9EBD0_9ACTN|nr:ABC transporter permease [Actinomadura luteofluorescens]NYD44644.1 peptide/nickel transport system permease protein [Actinomadura luteofluorescens]
MSAGTDVDRGAEAAAPAIVGRSPWSLGWARLRRDRAAMISLGLIVLVIAMALLAPLAAVITGHPPNTQYRTPDALSPEGLPVGPSGRFWFGTDDLGRDIFVRIAYGARVSLLVGVAATALAVAIGVVVGLAAGFLGGVTDTLLARFVDVVLSVPFILVAIALVSVSGSGLGVSITVIGSFSWAAIARIVRGQVLSLREREFVEAARSLGARSVRIMFVEILPNVLAPIVVYATLLMPVAIVAQASLSYLGLGLPPPTADWGGMISAGQKHYTTAWWYIVFPGAALLVTTVAFNLLGDGVRDAFDPRAGLRKG